MGKLLAYLREVMVMAFLAGAVVRWVLQLQKSDEEPLGSLDTFTESLAASPARYKPQALFDDLKSGRFNELIADDKITFLLDMTQTFVQPGMSDTETIHVRSTFIAALSGMMLDIANMNSKLSA